MFFMGYYTLHTNSKTQTPTACLLLRPVVCSGLCSGLSLILQVTWMADADSHVSSALF